MALRHGFKNVLMKSGFSMSLVKMFRIRFGGGNVWRLISKGSDPKVDIYELMRRDLKGASNLF